MKTKHLYVCSVGLTVMLIALGINGYRKTSATEPAFKDPVQLNNQESSAGPVRNLRFTLFEQGIRPAAIRTQAGFVNIAVEDRTTDGDGLLISRVEAGQRTTVGNVRKFQNYARGRAQFRLTPGTYELHDTVRPSNKALLIVEP